jgi:hypothetical protein
MPFEFERKFDGYGGESRAHIGSTDVEFENLIILSLYHVGFVTLNVFYVQLSLLWHVLVITGMLSDAIVLTSNRDVFLHTNVSVLTCTLNAALIIYMSMNIHRSSANCSKFTV